MEVQATGFRNNVVNNVHALIGKQTESSVQLEVGAATEVVEVTASSQEALINTQDASLGNNFISEQITQLPLEARNLVDLLSLQPGSTREGYTTGARADQSNVTLDGVDINNAQSGNAQVPLTTNTLGIGTLGGDRGDITSGPVLRLNAEAIEEFRVTTANGGANQGRSSRFPGEPRYQVGHQQLAWRGFRILPLPRVHGQRLVQYPRSASGGSAAPDPEYIWRSPGRSYRQEPGVFLLQL